MHVTWIGGWGVAPESVRPVAEKHFAQSQHTFLPPTKQAMEEALATGANSLSTLSASDKESAQVRASQDLLVGWSFGAWRILDAAARGAAFPGMVLLFAPFVAFPSEAGLGGKCSATQVKFLRRWLQREPLAAIADFCKRAEIPAPPTPAESAPPYALPDLLEGLNHLSETATPALQEFATRGLPRNW